LDGEDPTRLSKKNSEYVCGIPVPDNYNRKYLYSRFKSHSETSGHILACSQRAEEVKNATEEQISEPTEAQIENKRLEQEKVLYYIENRIKPKFPWLQLSEGKLFCTVRNIQYSINPGNFRAAAERTGPIKNRLLILYTLS